MPDSLNGLMRSLITAPQCSNTRIDLILSLFFSWLNPGSLSPRVDRGHSHACLALLSSAYINASFSRICHVTMGRPLYSLQLRSPTLEEALQLQRALANAFRNCQSLRWSATLISWWSVHIFFSSILFLTPLAESLNRIPSDMQRYLSTPLPASTAIHRSPCLTCHEHCTETTHFVPGAQVSPLVY